MSDDINFSCGICKSNSYEIVYSGPIRSGTYGKVTSDNHIVVRCHGCSAVQLGKFLDVQYASSQYREAYNGSDDIDNYFTMHDHEQLYRLEKIGVPSLRGKHILDYGCGGGAFLDAISGFAAQTFGVEPFIGYHESLRDRGHQIFANGHELAATNQKFDLITMFGVIEHLEKPLEHLKLIRGLLNDGGRLIVDTDNFDDFIMQHGKKEIEKFYFRTVHNWYFNAKSLNDVLVLAGFKTIKSDFVHRYDLGNTINWLAHGQPPGFDSMPDIPKPLNDMWKAFVCETGKAELLFFEASE